jgi:tetratricopeptide (TPR) repeat protein
MTGRRIIFRLLAFLCLALAAHIHAASDDDFTRGMKAIAAKDYPTALTLLEAALSADPDNLQYSSEYRRAVLALAKALHPKEGQPADFDRSLKFFERLVAEHPKSANAWLNYGFAYVDKIPSAGAISQVILANTALQQFDKAVELSHSWIAYYTRGNSYLFWPKIFDRAPLGVADLEAAMKLQKAGPEKPYHLRVYVSLGDGYWKTDNLAKARSTWKSGLAAFPDSNALKERLARQGEDLKAVIDDALDPNKRVDTDLRELWMNP